MAEARREGSSPYNLRTGRKGPSPRRPLRENVSDLESSEDEIDSSPRKETSSPGFENVSVSTREGISPQSSRNTRSPAATPQSVKSVSSNSSFERSPTPCKRSPVKSVHDKSKGPNQQEQANNSAYYIFSASVIVILIVLAGNFLVKGNFDANVSTIRADLDPDGGSRISFHHFQERFKELKAKFPEQEKDFWRTVFGLLRPKIVEKNPIAPAVFMMVVPDNQHGESRTAECLAKQLLTLYTGLFNRSMGSQSSHIHITRDLMHKSPAEDKKELDNKLQNIFDKSQGKGVILDNFESLSPFAALLLHGYCDGDNAPYKDVLFIQVVHTDKQVGEITSQRNYMDKYLKELWVNELDEDKIQPLLTRIANNVAIVTPENEKTLHQHC